MPTPEGVIMPALRIYRPIKNAMQSGRANSKLWRVEFEPADKKTPDPLMGWNGSRDTRSQVKMTFETKEAAIAFAQKNGYSYEIKDSEPPAPPAPKTYADNFRFDRVE
jgi:hypothetical protein